MSSAPPEGDSGLERLGETAAFSAELERLAKQAPNLWRAELLRLSQRVEETKE
jgi:hypothetical protein